MVKVINKSFPNYPCAILLHLMGHFVIFADQSQPKTLLTLVVREALQTLITKSLDRLGITNRTANRMNDCQISKNHFNKYKEKQ